jgi:hypothetical protein
VAVHAGGQSAKVVAGITYARHIDTPGRERSEQPGLETSVGQEARRIRRATHRQLEARLCPPVGDNR